MQHPHQEMITLDRKEVPRQRRLTGGASGLPASCSASAYPLQSHGCRWHLSQNTVFMYSVMHVRTSGWQACPCLLRAGLSAVPAEVARGPAPPLRPALLPTGGRERGLCLRDGPSAGASPRRRARDATSSLPNDHAPGLLACTRAQSLRISLKAPPVGAANAILAPDIQQILEIAKSPLYPAA